MYGIKKGSKPCGKRKNYANGGVIRGAGTGTSDDIKKTVPEGAYIMPADSTKAIGQEALDSLGNPVPVNVSNGEYQLPPEQVHAIGVQALDQMKDATHKETGMGFRQGQSEQLFFADGGVVRDKDKEREQIRSQLRSGPFSSPARVPGATGANPYADSSLNEPIGRGIREIKASGQDIGRRLSQPVRALHGAAQNAAASIGESNQNYINRMRANKGLPSLESVEQEKTLNNAMVRTPDRQPSQMAAGGVRPRIAMPTDGMVGKMVSDLNSQNGASTPGNQQVSVPLRQPGGTTGIDMNAANQSLADANASRQQTIDAQPRGFRKVIGDSATDKRNESMDLKLALRDAERNGDSRAVVALNEQMQKAGIADKTNKAAMDRLGIVERGKNRRSDQDYNLQSRRLSGEEEALGFGIRNQKRLESLYQQYEEASPEEKAEIAEQIRVLTGKDDTNKYTVVPGGEGITTDALGNAVTVKQPSFAINNRSGEIVSPGGQQGSQAQSQQVDTSKFVEGKVYTDANGNRARWNGSQFIEI